MKPFALLVLLVLAIAAAVAPGVYGLPVDAQGKPQFLDEYEEKQRVHVLTVDLGTHLRRLQDQPNDEQPDDQQQPGTDDMPNTAGDDDNGNEILRGGCFPGSWNWPRCRFGGGGGGCFPGSWNWPRCRYGGGGGCFPGSWGWPRCRGF
jgi:hypothetical protein